MVARPTRKRLYRSMQGRMVDIEKLRAANENVQAVGNMNVNARGDVLGKGGQVVTAKETVIKKYYEQPRGMVDDRPARSKPAPQRKTAPKQAPQPKAATKPTKVTRQTKPKAKPKKGIEEALDGLE